LSNLSTCDCARAGISEKTGQHSQVIRLTNRGRTSCVLSGYPVITLVDARGVLPFRIRRGGDVMITSRRPRPVAVRAGGRAFVVINKYRCDLGDRRVARTLRLGLPQAISAGRLSLRISHGTDLGYCGKGAPGSTVATSPFEPSVRAALRPY
jgi:Protein of unknown function (DUF4232)